MGFASDNLLMPFRLKRCHTKNKTKTNQKAPITVNVMVNQKAF